jgi:hypothetical protein|tara:strand:+ start:3142 stop:3429 length:288 start_codon:yes stop_codon:yes gene_type:complete
MSEVENSEGEVVEVSAVQELINNITDGELNSAEGSFQSLIQSKMADALEAQRIAVAQAMFNDDEVEDDSDIEEIDIEEEDEEEEVIAELDDEDED